MGEPSISAQAPETFDLICPNVFEQLVVRPRSERGRIPSNHLESSGTIENSSQIQKSIVNPSFFQPYIFIQATPPRPHPLIHDEVLDPQWIHDGFMDTVNFWVHDGFLDSRWIHDGF